MDKTTEELPPIIFLQVSFPLFFNLVISEYRPILMVARISSDTNIDSKIDQHSVC